MKPHREARSKTCGKGRLALLVRLIYIAALIVAILVALPVFTQFLATPRKNLDYVTYGPLSGEPPQSMIILLHGSGGAGRQMIDDIKPYFADSLPDTVFVAPNSPLTIKGPDYKDAFVWHEPYYRLSQSGINRRVVEIAPILEAFIMTQIEQHPDIDTNRIVLLGFSQGATMALYVAPRLDVKVGGVLAYSGRIAEAPLPAEGYKDIPLFLYYNRDDPYVSYSLSAEARDYFSARGHDVTVRSGDANHHMIGAGGMAAGLDFMDKIL